MFYGIVVRMYFFDDRQHHELHIHNDPHVKTVEPLNDYQLSLEFQTGERRLFDMKPYLSRGIFIRLQNPALFQAARVVAGSVEWPGGLDLSYDTLYLESRPVEAVASEMAEAVS